MAIVTYDEGVDSAVRRVSLLSSASTGVIDFPMDVPRRRGDAI